jgi:hypothetical protein
MYRDSNIRHAERAVLRSAFDDGLWDVLLGCFMLIFAVGPYVTSMGLGDFWGTLVFVPFWGIAFLAVRATRKRVVAPRIGTVKLGHSLRRELLRFNVLLMVFLLGALAVGLVSAGKLDRIVGVAWEWILGLFGADFEMNMDAWGLVYSIRFGLNVIVVSFAAAFVLGVRRLYFYGIMVAASPLIGEVLYRQAGVPHHGFPVTFGITAAAMLLTGLVIFWRLIRETSIPTEVLSHAEATNGQAPQ